MENVKIESGVDLPKRRHPKLEDYKYTFKLLRKNRLAIAGGIIVAIYFIIMGIDYIYPQYLEPSLSYIMNGGSQSFYLPLPPTFSHGWMYILGETEYNMPILPYILYALKLDLTYTVFIVGAGAGIGIVIGTISGYYGGYLDEVVMRITDIFFSIPTLVLALAIIFALQSQALLDIVYALIIIWWPTYARITRGQALSLKSMKYVEASTASGSSGIRNVFKHIMPNVLSPVMVQFSLDLGSIVGIFSTLIFIGFMHLPNPYIPELGNILYIGEIEFQGVGAWWALLFPGIFLFVFVVAVNLLGDGLRDVLDPRLRR